MPIDNPLPRAKKVLSHAGATGAILTTKLIHSMRRDGLKRGLVTLCIGGGQGIAVAIETAHQIVIRSS